MAEGGGPAGSDDSDFSEDEYEEDGGRLRSDDSDSDNDEAYLNRISKISRKYICLLTFFPSLMNTYLGGCSNPLFFLPLLNALLDSRMTS